MSHSVTFNETVKLDEFDKLEDFERVLIWWGVADYARFRSMCNKTVQALVTENFDDDSFYCKRGLESWGPTRSRERRVRIKASIKLVLDRQQNFRDDGIIDGFAVADIYEHQTRDCLIQARMRGAQDEESQLWERTMTDKESSLEQTETGNGELSSRVKRRRSSVEKQKGKSFGTSLQNFARKITSSSAA